jgi:hypothetical protein
MFLKGSDDGVQHSELRGFRTLSIVQYSKNYKTQRFGNWVCLCPEVRGQIPTRLGPLERTNLNPVAHFPKRYFFLEQRTMGKVRSSNNSEPYVCFMFNKTPPKRKLHHFPTYIRTQSCKIFVRNRMQIDHLGPKVIKPGRTDTHTHMEEVRPSASLSSKYKESRLKIGGGSLE